MSEKKENVVQVVSANPGWYARFRLEDGAFEHHPVAAWAVMTDGEDQWLSGFSESVRGFIRADDEIYNFAGWIYDPDLRISVARALNPKSSAHGVAAVPRPMRSGTDLAPEVLCASAARLHSLASQIHEGLRALVEVGQHNPQIETLAGRLQHELDAMEGEALLCAGAYLPHANSGAVS